MTASLWDKALAFHGHACPGLAIGVRACEVVMRDAVLGTAPYGGLVCVTENDACGVDAVQCLLGCSVGKGNLVFRNTGKHVYTFFDRENGRGMRLYAFFNKEPGLTREERQGRILKAPLDMMFTIGEPAFPLPEKARIFPTVSCEECGEGAAEHMIHLAEGRKLCPDCFEPYVRGW